MSSLSFYCASTSIFFRSFFTSDPFGKGIFLALFTLSFLSCYILISKFLSYKVIFSQIKSFKRLVETHEQKILQIPIQDKPSMNPFHSIYYVLQKTALKLLKKNQYFSMNEQKAATLSNNDLNHIHQALERSIEKQGLKLSKNLFILSTVVSLAPFLGILGTVWGILISLSSMQESISTLGNSGVLAGLSTALATTVLGLVIAIPALISFNYLKNCHQLVMQEMDLLAHDLIAKVTLSYQQVVP